MSDVSTLDILLHGETIGTSTNVGGDRTLFAFAQSYVENTTALASRTRSGD